MTNLKMDAVKRSVERYKKIRPKRLDEIRTG